MKWLCKIGIHPWVMSHHHLVTVEEGMKRLWVVLVCQRCETIKRIGMAHESEAGPDTKETPLHGYRLL